MYGSFGICFLFSKTTWPSAVISNRRRKSTSSRPCYTIGQFCAGRFRVHIAAALRTCGTATEIDPFMITFTGSFFLKAPISSFVVLHDPINDKLYEQQLIDYIRTKLFNIHECRIKVSTNKRYLLTAFSWAQEPSLGLRTIHHCASFTALSVAFL